MTALLIPYLLVALVAWRLVGGHFMWATTENDDLHTPEFVHIFFAGIVGGLLAAVTWPVWAFGWLAYKGSARALGPIGGLPVIGAEKRMREERKAAKRLELEKELGL